MEKTLHIGCTNGILRMKWSCTAETITPTSTDSHGVALWHSEDNDGSAMQERKQKPIHVILNIKDNS